MARLIVVSNRVSVPDVRSGTRAGGLEVAVRAALRNRSGLWFGWSGRTGSAEENETRVIEEPGGLDYVVTDLPREDYEEYYNGFANRVLWPLLHYRFDLAEFSRRDLSGYLRVNEHFARELDKVLEPDDIVWVHDYHFIPLARALRERGRRNRIGFFLHVPCPPPEILTALPNHRRIIPALCEYDLVGFQTGDDAFNFSRYLTRECGLHSRDYSFLVGERTMRVDAFPVGIDAQNFARMARRSMASSFVKEVLGSLGGRDLIIGVDRLDYSKGIAERLNAFEKFIATHPEWRSRFSYLQITPRSRSDIPEYADMEAQVTASVGRINGQYGEASWTPIRYVNRAHGRAALAGLYRAARVGLVTPLRDGMNLVAKEFVAAQDSTDPGVLILSQFAGAARELEAALIVNPYDAEAVAAAIATALSLPLEERRSRHQAMLGTVMENSVDAWVRRFLNELTSPEQQPFWRARAAGAR